eukprot:UN33019
MLILFHNLIFRLYDEKQVNYLWNTTNFLKLVLSTLITGSESAVLGFGVAGILAMLLNYLSVSQLSLPSHSQQLILLIIFGYLSYGLGQLFGFAGIISLLFCAITLSHYTWHSLSDHVKVSARNIFDTVADPLWIYNITKFRLFCISLFLTKRVELRISGTNGRQHNIRSVYILPSHMFYNKYIMLLLLSKKIVTRQKF